MIPINKNWPTSRVHYFFISIIWICFMNPSQFQNALADISRATDLGIKVGRLPSGKWNAITDVAGVRVGHKTLSDGKVQTGVTSILAHNQNPFQFKVPAAVYVGNGFGKLAGTTQINELGTLESPILLTNTLNVGMGIQTLVDYLLKLPGNESVFSVNAVVGETNDAHTNDIRNVRLQPQDFLFAIENAKSGPVPEGSVGAGTGVRSFGYKSGIGTASRKVSLYGTEYTVGVLMQSNYGGNLKIKGIPIPKQSKPDSNKEDNYLSDKGSCMMIVATDAPLDTLALKRLAKRTMIGIGNTGSYLGNSSGDYAIAFSTAYTIPNQPEGLIHIPPLVPTKDLSKLFEAVVEATEESFYNSLLTATPKPRHFGGISSPISKEVLSDLLIYHRMKESN